MTKFKIFYITRSVMFDTIYITRSEAEDRIATFIRWSDIIGDRIVKEEFEIIEIKE